LVSASGKYNQRRRCARGDFKATSRDSLTPCDAVTQHHLSSVTFFTEQSPFRDARDG
jgi:hypothetical protein